MFAFLTDLSGLPEDFVKEQMKSVGNKTQLPDPGRLSAPVSKKKRSFDRRRDINFFGLRS